MKPKFTLLLITSIVFQLLLTKCSNNRTEQSDTNDNFIEINIDELDLKDSVLFSTFFSGVKLIPLETNTNCLIGRIADIVIVNDTIYILDAINAKSLFVFDLQGNFIRKIGNVGRGPGEYNMPHSFTVDTKHNQIHIVDRFRKILTYTLNGKFIKEVTPEFGNSIIQSIKNLNGVNYVEHSINNADESAFYVSAIDNSGNILNQWLPSHIYSNGYNSGNTVNQLVKTNSNIKFMRPYWDTIFTIQSDNKIRPFIHLSTQNKITEYELNEMREYNLSIAMNPGKALKERGNRGFTEKFQGVMNYVESPNLIMFEFNNKVTHSMFYSPNTNKYICTNRWVIDDLAQVESMHRFYSSYENYFVSAVDPNFGKLNTLINNLKNGKIKPKNKNQIDLEKLNENSNPVVILYECKDGFE